jgi:CHAT domain-containing protein
MLKAKLVVLSSCQSGFGKFVHGEGIVSLAQGFLQAGSQAVTMSLWEAQDGSTAYIMGKYYGNLDEGMPKNEALRQAKLDYLGHTSHQKHPFFWAAFVNVGNPSPIVENNYLPAILLGGLMLFVILTIYYFRYNKKN